jgi:hypothetical protein
MDHPAKAIMTALTSKAAIQSSNKRRAHDYGSLREAPAKRILAVILWDESGSIRHTGSGNLTQVNVTTESRR